jgi:hypothetical protein
MHIKTWHVELFLYEDGDDTSARAVLHSDALEHPEGYGRARRAPTDPAVPEIGDELAAARALHALADALLVTTTEDIEAIEHRPVRLAFQGPAQVQTPRVPGSRAGGSAS